MWKTDGRSIFKRTRTRKWTTQHTNELKTALICYEYATQLTLLRKFFTKRPSISLLLYPIVQRHQLKFLCSGCLCYHELTTILHVNSLIPLIWLWKIS